MKTQSTSRARRGFTLMELMVAMAITTIIVTVLVTITSLALDTWNRSRAELRASRQAKSMIDSLARDFESLVTRKGNTSEWLSAVYPTDVIGKKLESTNAADLVFFTAATDRYKGQIGTTTDLGGDVSCVAYQLTYRDPLSSSGTGDFPTFVLNRMLVDPDQTFEKLLGKDDLAATFKTSYGSDLEDPEWFVCENVFQFSITFHVQVTDTTATPPKTVTVPITINRTDSSNTTKKFKITGKGIDSDATGGAVTPEQLASGRVTAVEISMTVISDFGIDQLRNRTFSGSQQAEFMAKNSYEYTKLVQLPSM